MQMKKSTFAIILASMACAANAADTFDQAWIADQTVTQVNKERGHATFMPYADKASLMADSRFDTPWEDPQNANFVDLNGTWKFRFVPGTPEGPGKADFEAADLDDSAWDDIRVPMSWEMTGSGTK